MNKSFSVIIPTYNSEKYISDCLNSIINQNYNHHLIEVLIIDDGSKDNTKKVIEPFLKYDFIKYYLKSNGQWGSVINYVKENKLANNDYISILDADDQLLSNAFKIINNECNNNDIFVGSFWKWNGRRKVKKIYPYWFLFKRTLTDKKQMNSPFCLPLIYFVKKEIFYQTRNLTEKIAYQDPDYISQLIKLSSSLKFTRKSIGLYYYNRIGNSISQSWTKPRFYAEINACYRCNQNDASEIISYRLNLKDFYYWCRKENIKFIINDKLKFLWYPWYIRWIYKIIHLIRFKKFFIIE